MSAKREHGANTSSNNFHNDCFYIFQISCYLALRSFITSTYELLNATFPCFFWHVNSKGSYILKPKSQEGPSLVCLYGLLWTQTESIDDMLLLWQQLGNHSSYVVNRCHGIISSWGVMHIYSVEVTVSLFACTAFTQCSLLNVNVLLKSV